MPNEFVTPDTTAYLFLGLAVIAVVMGGYVLSLLARMRSAENDWRTLDQLED
jgi:hypothetical protein